MPVNFTDLVQWGVRDDGVRERHEFNTALEGQYEFSFTLSTADDTAGHDLEFYLLFSPPTGATPKLENQDRVWVDLEFQNGICKVWADGTPPNDPSIGHGASPLRTVAGTVDGGSITYLVNIITAYEGDIEDQSGRNVTADLADEPDGAPGRPPLYIYTMGLFNEGTAVLASKGKSTAIHITAAGPFVPPEGGNETWGDPNATWGDPNATWASP